MSQNHSVTKLIGSLHKKTEFSAASHQIWDRFIEQLITLADRKLKGLPRRVADEEDVAAMAFDAFFRGVKDGRFKQLDNRNDLWQILVMLTDRKAVGLMREQLADKRGAGKVRGESVFEHALSGSGAAPGLSEIPDPHDTSVDLFTDKLRSVLDNLPDKLKRIALSRLEGRSYSEIATELGIAIRSVERKMKIIRDSWAQANGD